MTSHVISAFWTLNYSFWKNKSSLRWESYFEIFYSITNIKAGRQNLRLTNIRFTTISSQFFTNYIIIFHKTEVQTVILRGWLIGSKVMAQNANISLSGFFQCCKFLWAVSTSRKLLDVEKPFWSLIWSGDLIHSFIIFALEIWEKIAKNCCCILKNCNNASNQLCTQFCTHTHGCSK